MQKKATVKLFSSIGRKLVSYKNAVINIYILIECEFFFFFLFSFSIGFWSRFERLSVFLWVPFCWMTFYTWRKCVRIYRVYLCSIGWYSLYLYLYTHTHALYIVQFLVSYGNMENNVRDKKQEKNAHFICIQFRGQQCR